MIQKGFIVDLNKLFEQFESLFSRTVEGVSSAPGRVNLIGEFTDYNDGYVLPCALPFRTYVAYRKRSDNIIMAYSTNYPDECEAFELAPAISHGMSHWGNYVRAIAYVYKMAGYQLSGMDILISSNVPQGAGLSSSAALEVALGGALNQAFELDLTLEKIALLGQQAENYFLGCQCGIMDQLVSAKAIKNQALMIDCMSLAIEHFSVPEELALIVINSNFPRKLVESEYNQRRRDCMNAAAKMGVSTLRQASLNLLEESRALMTLNEYKRAHHVITENRRVLQAAKALQENNLQALSELMAESHISLRDNFEVTVAVTDGLVDICHSALGTACATRMTGGGFGGAVICICRHGDVPKIVEAVSSQYHQYFGLQETIYVVNAAGGLMTTLGTDRSALVSEEFLP
ncbi:galactokinase [Shewanella sp. NR704-98]|uniref:Galactokinase n=1 Tax=Shewanella nanhaiensis TaxID=2864872 RepID=A0ABS7E8H5_9GAMM|nr:galactokinase [Shewanella nanhaiensis]